MKYKFSQFIETISDPTIEVTYIHNNIINKEVSVDLILITPEQDYGVNLDGFSYTSTFTTDEVLTWAFVELEKYEV